MYKKRNRTFVVVLLMLAVLLTGVYALLATTLNIGGTATGTGDFKIEFSNYSVSDDSKATATLDANKTKLTITADLIFPGDTVTVNFTIKNTGTLGARVNNLIINENSTDDFTIKVNGLSSIQGTVLSGNETTTGSITITWNVASTNPTPDVVDFDVTIDYVQAV